MPDISPSDILKSGPTPPPAQMTRKVSAPARPDARGWYSATGRRKTAVARVRIKPGGSGKFDIRTTLKNHKSIDVYFTEDRDRLDAIAALRVTNLEGKMDVLCRCNGGGYMGQAQAIRLGVARALVKMDPNFYEVLRENGFLTRDPREVERKKYGQAGARRRFQFSKR
jgi:small subunit ribosomal protein S9